jgi:acetolactate synthase small subunit
MSTTPEPAAARESTTLVVLLHDRHGSVERVLGAARRQGCTVANLAIEPVAEPGLARVSLTIAGGQPARLAQQLTRIVDVIDVRGATDPNAADSPSLADIVRTPFHSQADGAAPRERDPASPDTLMED